VLLHRAFTLVVLLIGVGLGIPLGRFWAEVPEAEAAKKVTWRCLQPTPNGSLVIHNPGDSPLSYTLQEVGGAGVHGDESDAQSLPPGAVDYFSVHVGGVLIIRASGPVLVDSTVEFFNDSAKQGACFKGK
jgi:hypothetical protein